MDQHEFESRCGQYPLYSLNACISRIERRKSPPVSVLRPSQNLKAFKNLLSRTIWVYSSKEGHVLLSLQKISIPCPRCSHIISSKNASNAAMLPSFRVSCSASKYTKFALLMVIGTPNTLCATGTPRRSFELSSMSSILQRGEIQTLQRERVHHSKLALCNLSTIFLIAFTFSSSTQSQTLKISISLPRKPLPGISQM